MPDDISPERLIGRLEANTERLTRENTSAQTALAAYRETTDRLRRQRDHGMLAGMPVWVRAAVLVGFPTVVAAFFMGQSAGWVPSVEGALAETLRKRQAVFDQHLSDTLELASAIKTASRIMCLNAARDESQRRLCEAIR